MGWTNLLAVEDLPSGTRKVLKVDDKAVLLLNHNDRIFAVDKRCPHLKLSMQKGKITDDGCIVCPWHRSRFDLTSGQPQEWTPWPPGVGKVMGMLSQEQALPVYPTRIEEGAIWVDL